MHKILLEENANTSIEHQRRLNQVTNEVVRIKVLKWLNVDFIYAILDSPWVSPVHMVTKKGGSYGYTFSFRKIPFGLCNAHATFQRCMMSMFSDFVEEAKEIFMDDFSVYGSSLEKCLENLETLLQRCQDKNLALNWEKCHFMVTEGTV